VDELESALADTRLGRIDREEVIELVKRADTNGKLSARTAHHAESDGDTECGYWSLPR
jgi:uncharacterized cupin superfamily protein